MRYKLYTAEATCSTSTYVLNQESPSLKCLHWSGVIEHPRRCDDVTNGDRVDLGEASRSCRFSQVSWMFRFQPAS